MPGNTSFQDALIAEGYDMLESLTLLSVAEIDELSEGLTLNRIEHQHTFTFDIYSSVFILSNSDEAGSQKDLPDQNPKG
jgi:hypothetical protein